MRNVLQRLVNTVLASSPPASPLARGGGPRTVNYEALRRMVPALTPSEETWVRQGPYAATVLDVLAGVSLDVSVAMEGFPPQRATVLFGERQLDPSELRLRSDIRVGDILEGLRLVSVCEFGPVLDFSTADGHTSLEMEQLPLGSDGGGRPPSNVLGAAPPGSAGEGYSLLAS